MTAIRTNYMRIHLAEQFVESLSERLALRNLEPEVAYDGEQALAMARETMPRAI